MSNTIPTTPKRSDAKFAATSSKQNPAHALIAGYLAGFSGTVVGYPLDSLKVWVQTNTMGKNRHLGNYTKDASANHGSSCGKSRSRSSFVESTPKIYKRCNSTRAILVSSKSPLPTAARSAAPTFQATIFNSASTVFRTARALYSGVSGPLVTVGLVQSVNFAIYNATRQFLYRQQHPDCSDPKEYLARDSLWNVGLSASVGGVATAVLTAPLLMIKINQQTTGNSFREALKEIFIVQTGSSFRLSPLRPYQTAFLPHTISESVGRCIYVSSYEGLKRSLARHNNQNGAKGGSPLSLGERMLCAASSGILCWAAFFPLDALRNRMYHASASFKTKHRLSVVETIRVMHSERAFYRGFSISILRAGPVAAAVLPVYDITLEKLSSWK